MPWLTIIMALVAFFAAGGANKDQRGKAAMVALGVGAATYGVTHHTDWGKENLGWLDGVDLEVNADGSTDVTTGPTQGGGGKIPSPVTDGPGTSTTGSSGFWNTIGGWLKTPAGQLTTGVAVGSAAGIPNWLLWGGVGLGAYLLLKD